jgi:heme/copper-type cytochrome/quinol oxidase subunit 1
VVNTMPMAWGAVEHAAVLVQAWPRFIGMGIFPHALHRPGFMGMQRRTSGYRPPAGSRACLAGSKRG